MRAPTLATVTLLFVLAACSAPEAAPAPAQDPNPAPEMTTATSEDPGLAHTVYFWLKPELDDAARAEFVAGMRSLSGAPTVRRVLVGPAAATPSRGVVDNSFDYMLVLWFDDVAGHDAYQVDPVHLAFVEGNEDKWTTVKVYDAEVE